MLLEIVLCKGFFDSKYPNKSLFDLHFTTGWIFKKRGYEGDDFLFRTVIKISKIKFTQFLHTSASKFFLGLFLDTLCLTHVEHFVLHCSTKQ